MSGSKTKTPLIATGLAGVSLVVSFFALSQGDQKPADNQLPKRVSIAQSNDFDDRLAALEQQINLAETTPAEVENNIEDRLTAIEASLAKLTSAMDGITLESASTDRDTAFRAEDGYLKADAYFAAEKFAIAGEGYLTFLESNPNHPEAYDILKRARQAFAAAGYQDKAVWAQEQLLANLGETKQADDLMTLARLQKDAGDLENAIKSADRAADLSTEADSRLWNRMYWAWYNQLQAGETAGLEAYREVEREIDAAGRTDDKLGVTVRERIEQIQRATRSSQTSAK